MFIINVINSIPSPNIHMVNIIFATILIIIVIILSVKRTTINGITTTRRVHVGGHDLGLGRGLGHDLDLGRDCSRGYYSRSCSCSRSRSRSRRNI